MSAANLTSAVLRCAAPHSKHAAGLVNSCVSAAARRLASTINLESFLELSNAFKLQELGGETVAPQRFGDLTPSESQRGGQGTRRRSLQRPSALQRSADAS